MAAHGAVRVLPAADTARLAAGAALQHLLPQLVASALDVKQAHWNVTGPGFLALHDLTDELAARLLAWSDRIAERILALGLHADARATTVAHAAVEFPLGRLSDAEVIGELVGRIDALVRDAKRVLGQLAATDPVGEQIVLDVIEGLEADRWKLSAQRS
jgi:starvation-inducible DNA-binding protein